MSYLCPMYGGNQHHNAMWEGQRGHLLLWQVAKDRELIGRMGPETCRISGQPAISAFLRGHGLLGFHTTLYRTRFILGLNNSGKPGIREDTEPRIHMSRPSWAVRPPLKSPAPRLSQWPPGTPSKGCCQAWVKWGTWPCPCPF